MEKLPNNKLIPMNNQELRNNNGGVVWWAPIAIYLLYEAMDYISSNGENLSEANQNGLEAGGYVQCTE